MCTAFPAGALISNRVLLGRLKLMTKVVPAAAGFSDSMRPDQTMVSILDHASWPPLAAAYLLKICSTSSRGLVPAASPIVTVAARQPTSAAAMFHFIPDSRDDLTQLKARSNRWPARFAYPTIPQNAPDTRPWRQNAVRSPATVSGSSPSRPGVRAFPPDAQPGNRG